ncbi:MAG: hypothetical protein LBH11_01195, partial [Propionibacteriaceae bacterium]|nr:hypothetical protein [Propionibacteriaceae bacterium]
MNGNIGSTGGGAGVSRPSIGRPVLWSFPKHREWWLDNGIRVWAFDLPGQAVVSADVVFELPLATEPRPL